MIVFGRDRDLCSVIILAFVFGQGDFRIPSCYPVVIMGQGDAGGRAWLAYLAGHVSVLLCLAMYCAISVPGWTASPCPVTFYCAGGQNTEPTNP